MKTIKSACCLLLTVLFILSVFIVNIPAAKAEGGVPGQVTNLRVTETYPSAIHFEWDPVEGASYYRVIPYNEGEPNDMDEIFTTGCGYWFWTWDFYGPNPSVEIEVRAVNEYGSGEASESRIGAAADAPEAMREITGFEVLSTHSGPNEENRSDTITFGYDFPLDTLYFYMECSTNPDMSNSVIRELEPGVGVGGCTYSESVYTEHTFIGFSPETTYYFQAHSRYYYSHYDEMDGTEDVYIETVSDIIFCRTNDPLEAPENNHLSISHIDAGANNIDVNVETMCWEDYSAVKVYYSTSPDDLLTESCNMVKLPINANEYITFHITGLNPSTNYYIQAVGCNIKGDAPPTEILEVSTTEGEALGEVQNLQAETYPYAVLLSWDPLPGAEYYRIPADMEPIETTETHAWLRDVQPGSDYTFNVQGINATGDGPFTSISVTTPDYINSNPSYINNLEVYNVEQEEVWLRFTPVNDAQWFSVIWSTDPDFTNYWEYDVQKTEAQDYAYIRLSTGEPEFELPPETICYFKIIAKNEGPTMDSDPYLTSSNVVLTQTGDANALPEGSLSWFIPPDSILGENEYIAESDNVTVCVLGGVMPRNVTGAAGYRIYYSTSPDPIAGGTYNEYTMFTSEYAICTVEGLAPLTTYNLQIVPFNHLGEGIASDILTVTTAAPEGIETQEGTDVNISDPVTGASFLFDNVIISGLTTIEPLDNPPENTYFYFVESCGYFDIETTASFDGSVSVTLPYDPELITGLESDLRLYQFKDGEPIDITVSVDTLNNTIIGEVTDHFCAFAIGIPEKSTVSFNSNGGSTVENVEANYNTTINAPIEPVKTGYSFAGWYKNEECTIKWNFASDTVTEDTTLYAKWLYNFSGFFEPIDMDGVLNVVKAGRSIPIKFSLGGDMGLDIFEEGYPKVYNYYDYSGQTEDYIETITFSNSGLTFDPVSNQYTYVWKTDKEWSGTCKQLFIRFRDGTVKVIYFKFR